MKPETGMVGPNETLIHLCNLHSQLSLTRNRYSNRYLIVPNRTLVEKKAQYLRSELHS